MDVHTFQIRITRHAKFVLLIISVLGSRPSARPAVGYGALWGGPRGLPSLAKDLRSAECVASTKKVEWKIVFMQNQLTGKLIFKCFDRMVDFDDISEFWFLDNYSADYLKTKKTGLLRTFFEFFCTFWDFEAFLESHFFYYRCFAKKL